MGRPSKSPGRDGNKSLPRRIAIPGREVEANVRKGDWPGEDGDSGVKCSSKKESRTSGRG